MCLHQSTLCCTKWCPVPAEVYSWAGFADPFHGLHPRVGTASDLSKCVEDDLGNVFLCDRTSVFLLNDLRITDFFFFLVFVVGVFFKHSAGFLEIPASN